MKRIMEYYYLLVDEATLFTVVLLPDNFGKFPIVIVRTPYVDELENYSDADALSYHMEEYEKWIENGYAFVLQHCRGRGRSSGDCIPYINERKDGLYLLNWIRQRDFYNGELFLWGKSYLTSAHYGMAPFASDIKGAVFEIQDSNTYNLCYRNGFFKKGLVGDWYVGMYKAKAHIKKNYSFKSFDMLPLSNFSTTVFGERADKFDEILKHPDCQDVFWKMSHDGIEVGDVTDHVPFPVLFTTGFYDIYTGGIFEMWNRMDDDCKKKSAMVVSPNDHGGNSEELEFENGKLEAAFGEDYCIRWFQHIRGIDKEPPFKLGEITYYRLFENRWKAGFSQADGEWKIKLGDRAESYIYNPFDPPEFRGGLSRAFGGGCFQNAPYQRYDIITVYSEPAERDIFVKGRMSARLCAKSDCEDTCFYIRVSLVKEEGDFGLRDDITSLCFQLGEYLPDTIAELDFCFDEHAFLIRKGEKIRVDISSADNAHYVRHTNTRGLYSEQAGARIARNTVYLHKSYLILPVE